MNGDVPGHASSLQMVTLDWAAMHARCENGSEVAMWVTVNC